MARIKKLAEKPENLHLIERYLVVALNNFFMEMERYRELLGDLTIFASFVNYLDQIENGLDEGMGWILDTHDGKLEYSQLLGNLVNNVAPELETLLDSQLSVNSSPGATSKIVEEINADIQLLTERYWDDIRKKGYELHDVLIGSV